MHGISYTAIPEPFWRVPPGGAFSHPDLKEFVLPYEKVRQAASPDAVLLNFLQSTYNVAADLGRWNRKTLERAPSSK